MKIKCPNCQTDLRYIASSKLFLCNDCGYHIEGEQDPEPVKVQSAEPISTTPKPKITHSALRKYKPWDFKSGRFIYLGVSLAAIAVLSIGIRQYQQYQTSKEIDAAIARGKEISAEIERNRIDIKELPQVCWPRPHIHLSYKMFTDCFVEGVTYRDVATMIGTVGKLASKSGPMSIYQWGDPTYGMVTISFIDGQLSSKNQVNLEMVTSGDDEAPE